MRTLNEQEIKNVKGGLTPAGTFVIGAIATIIVGILDGFCRPIRCNY